MSKWLRRLRGALSTALTWAGIWSGAGMLIGTTGLFGDLAPVEYVVFGGVFAILGLIGGTAFSLVLSLVEGRRSLDELTLPRIAAWGAAGGALLQLVMLAVGQGAGLPTWIFFMLLGSVSAVASLAIARRAQDRDPLEVGDGLAEARMSEAEKRDLLGTPSDLGASGVRRETEREPVNIRRE